MNQRRFLDPLIQRQKVCDRGVREAKAQPLRYSASSASGTVRSKQGKEEQSDPNDTDQHTEKNSFRPDHYISDVREVSIF